MDATKKMFDDSVSIFNVFFSRSIPLYMGPSDTNKYFNYESYIDVNNIDENIYKRILELNTNEDIYNKFINNNKINDFNNQDYISLSKKFIFNKI